MGDSEDEYDRKRRDKFRGERSDYREPTRRPPPEDRRRDDWNDRGDWNRNRGPPPPRPIDYRLGGAPRPGPHEFSPPNKRPRGDWDRGDRYGPVDSFPPHGYGPYDHPPQHGAAGYIPPPPPHHHRDDSHGPGGILSFKAWLSTQDDCISDQEALTKYAAYKKDFKRQQLNEFFLAHRDEEWFRSKYHPDESTKRKDEQLQNLKKRVNIFMEFIDKRRFDGMSLDSPHADKLTKLMDWYVIRLEDGSDEVAAKLLQDDRKHSLRTSFSSSTSKQIRLSESEKEPNKENGATGKEEKTPKEDSEGTASDSEDDKGNIGKSDEIKEVDSEYVSGDDEKDRSLKKSRTLSSDSRDLKLIPSDEEEKVIGEKTEEKSIKKEADEETPQLHRTSSVFLRNIPPGATKAEIEGLCTKYPGFLRSALADPQPERRWFRRGWVTFKRDVNIKEICWQLNNIRLKDAELGAIVNRDLTRRVRTVNGITPHKTIVRNDIRLAAQVIQFLDSKWKLWDDELQTEHKESFGVYSTNPVLKNITDYLIEEGSAEEEELLAMGGGSDDGEVESIDRANAIERDDELIGVLDRLVLYLRFVHSLDYYNHAEYPYEDEMPNRLGIMHGRGLPPTSTVILTELQDYNRNFEQKISTFCQKVDPLSDEECKALGMKEEEVELEKFITSNTQELGKDKWLCPLSGKKFKGPEFVRKHILNKHIEKLDEVKKEVGFFNNFLRDPKRPKTHDRRDQSGTGTAGGGDRGASMNQPQPMRREPLFPERGDYPPQPPLPFPPYGSYGPGPGYGGHYGPPRPYYGGGYNAPPRGGGRHEYRGRGNRPIISYRDLDAPPDMDEF